VFQVGYGYPLTLSIGITGDADRGRIITVSQENLPCLCQLVLSLLTPRIVDNDDEISLRG
jgi:hypothetical protein